MLSSEENTKLANRLKRVAGQVSAIQRMVGEDALGAREGEPDHSGAAHSDLRHRCDADGNQETASGQTR